MWSKQGDLSNDLCVLSWGISRRRQKLKEFIMNKWTLQKMLKDNSLGVVNNSLDVVNITTRLYCAKVATISKPNSMSTEPFISISMLTLKGNIKSNEVFEFRKFTTLRYLLLFSSVFYMFKKKVKICFLHTLNTLVKHSEYCKSTLNISWYSASGKMSLL